MSNKLDAVIKFRNYREPDEATVLGQATLLGQTFHVMAVQVETVDGLQGPVCDPYNRFEDILTLNPDGALQTVEIPGHDGQWWVVMFPWGA